MYIYIYIICGTPHIDQPRLFYDMGGAGTRKQIVDSIVENKIAILGKDIRITKLKQQKTQQTLQFRSLQKNQQNQKKLRDYVLNQNTKISKKKNTHTHTTTKTKTTYKTTTKIK